MLVGGPKVTHQSLGYITMTGQKRDVRTEKEEVQVLEVLMKEEKK